MSAAAPLREQPRPNAAPGARRRRLPGRPPLLVLLALLVLAIVLVWTLLSTAIAPHAPDAQDLVGGLQGPSGNHLLGTDDSGRDILSRLIAGARSAVVGPALIVLGSSLLGTVLGLTAGYRGGWRDATLMRMTDFLYALPALLVAIVMVGVLGGGYLVAVAILIVFIAPADVRLVRGATLAQRGLPYVDAARTLGLSRRRILYRHVWPNILPLIVANSFLNFAYALVTMAALSFLGLGVAPGAADWGRMLSDNLALIEDNPLAALAPGIALVLTAVAMNLIGDWSYEKLAERGRSR